MGGERTIALTAAQHALWLAQRIDDACPYTVALYLDVDGPLDRERLRTAMKIAGAESGVNHARIVTVDGTPHFTIDVDATIPLDVVDLRTEPDPPTAAQKWMRADYTAPVDVNGAHLYHSALLRIADERHLLYLRSHHIVLDGYGAFTMINRIAEIYSSDEPPATTTPSIDAIARIAETDHAYAESPRAVRDLEYWTAQMSGSGDVASWSLQPPARPQHPTITELPWTFDDPDRIDAAALIAAIAFYQARVTDSDETVIGVPVSGRTTAFLRSTGGSLANVVPIRVRIGGEDADTIGGLVDQVRGALTGALRHQRFVDWDRVLGPGRSPNGVFYGTLVNVMPFVRPVLLGEVAAPIHVLTSGPVNDLSVNFYAGDTDHPMRMSLQWNPQRHSVSEIRRHGDRLSRITTAFLADDHATRLDDIAVLGTLELDDLTHRLGGPVSPPRTLPELIRAAVAANPDGPALVDGDLTLSYRQLDALSDRLARRLAERGAKPETAVAVAIPRSAQLLITLWAVAKTGAAYVPIDPSHPLDRTDFILTQTSAAFGVAAAEMVSTLPRRGFWITTDGVTQFDSDSADNRDDDSSIGSVSVDPRTAAYIIYTSGSTGRPKGVVVSHTGLSGFIDGHRARATSRAERRVLAVSAPTFDASIAEVLLALAFSAPLTIAPPEVYAADELAALIRDTGVTHAFLTPRVLASMQPAAGPGRSTVMSVGDTCSPRLVAEWSPGRSFVNDYGPTETTIWASGTPPLRPHAQVSIGRPVPGLRATVLDSRLRPVGVGIVGELYLSGPQLARGYCGRPDLTAERFVADPFGAPGERMYRTGDLVHWTSNGELVHRGRSDFQVKIRGQRIEPGDVESVLLGRREITAAVVVRSSDDAGERLIAYVTAHDPGTVDVDAVLADVADRLPDVMVPAQIVVLDALPLGTSGKLDRSALPAPLPRTPRHATPSDPIESVIADAVARVVGTDRGIGADDDFFALGGDSISAISLSSILRDRGVVIRPRDVFAHRTIGRMARAVSKHSTDVDDLLPELPGGGVGTIPLTPVASYILSQRGDLTRFVQVMSIDVPDDTGRDHLIAALDAVLTAHDMLRAHLVPGPDETWQLFTSAATGSGAAEPLLREILLAADASDDEVAARVRSEINASVGRLDPARGVNLAALWVRRELSEDTTYSGSVGRLTLAVHHIAIDAVSWRILLSDLMTAASSARSGAPVRLAPTGTSMRRWAHALADLSARGELAAEADHWRRVLATPDPPLGLRTFDPALDHVRISLTHQITLDLRDTQAVTVGAPRRHRAGVDDVLAGTLAVAVAIWRARRQVGTDATLLQLEGHGREESLVPGADLSRTVGWFTTVHPTAISLTDVDLDEALVGGHSLALAIKAAKAARIETPQHGIGYGLLRYPVDGATDTPALPDTTPQIGLNYLGRIGAREIARSSIDGWVPRPDPGDLTWQVQPDTPALRALDIDAIVLDGRMRITLAYPTTLLSPLEIRELGEIWSELLGAVRTLLATDTSAGDTTPADFGLVSLTQSDITGWETRFGPLTDVWPLTPTQTGLTFHTLTADTFDPYVVASVIDLAGTVDLDRLHRATEALLARHDALRTAFVPDERGEIVAVVVESVTATWRAVDLSSRKDPAAAFAGLMDYERSTPFDPGRPPLLRFVAVTMAPGVVKLLVVQHHVLLDGWSMPIVLRDLLLLYRDDATSAEPPPPSFAGYLSWRNLQDRDAARTAWTHAFSASRGPTLVAPSVGVSSTPATVNREVRRDIGTELTAQLDAATADIGVTLATIAELAWAILVGGIVDSHDVTIGATVAGRPADLEDADAMVGLFINTIPVRVRTLADDTLTTAARRLQREQTELLDHQFLGLTEIRSAVGDGALFDTSVAIESYPIDRDAIGSIAGDLGGAVMTGYDAVDATHHPISVVVVPGDNIRIRLTYRTDAFDSATVSSLLERYVRLLGCVVRERDTPIANLALTDENDLSERTVARTWKPPTLETTLIDAFAAQVARTPDVIAVTHGGRSLTYAELDKRSTALARLLIEAGVRLESTVAVALDRSLELFVAVYAVLRSGGVYVPVDVSAPAARIGDVLESADAAVIITDRTWSAPLTAAADFRRTRSTTPTIVVIDDPETAALLDTAPSDAISDDERGGPLRPANLAYLIHTSGSSGRPKGVAVSHRAITNQLAWRIDRLRIDAGDIVLHKTPISFDVSLWELFAPLQVGARVVVADPGAHADALRLAQTIIANRVTIVHFVPTVLGVFLAEPVAAGCISLRHVITSGEALPAQIARDVHRVLGARLHNLYGPTEAAIDITAHEVLPAAVSSGPPAIGTPVWNCSVLLLDRRLRPVPAGMTGELYLAGIQLARGYHDARGLTAERFVAHPFGAPGERLYRTGDVGRRDASGQLHFIGRNDNQVSLHGVRIELGDIESALSKNPVVAQSVAAVRDDRIVAYVRQAPGTVARPALIRSTVATSLPSHLVPSVIVVLDEFPVTVSGKLDRAALPAPGSGPSSSADTSSADTPSAQRPRRAETAAQRLVAGVMSDALGHIEIGLDDRLLSLGGNSISAMRIAGQLSAQSGTEVTIRDVLEAASVAELARLVDGRLAGDRSRIPLQRSEYPEKPPLSAAQTRMWLAARHGAGEGTYLVPVALRITGDPDVEALQIAVDTLIATHETLRTIYPTDDSGAPYQLVLPPDSTPRLITEDLTVDGAPTPAAVVAGSLVGFDLTTEVPMRIRLLRTGANEHVLLMVFHHIAVDGSSFAVLARDLVTAYQSAGVLPQRRVQYVDYAMWQRAVLGDRNDPRSRLSESLEFWAGRLADAPHILDLPVDRLRGTAPSAATGVLRRTVTDRVLAGVTMLAEQHRTTPFTVWHTAFAVALSRWTGGEDIVVATPVSGRDDPALDDLIGMFVNTIPIRTTVTAATPFADLLDSSSTAIAADLDHRDTPFDDIVERVNPQRSDGFSPLTQVLLAFQNHAEATLGAPGIELEQIDPVALAATGGPDIAVPETDSTEFAIAAEVTDGAIILRYSRELFDDSTIERFGRIVDHILRAIIDDPRVPVGDLPTLSSDEYRLLTTKRGRGDLEPSTLPELLARTVALRPHDIAVSDEQRSLTWWQLDRFTNRLARLLIEHGAGPETTVAVGIPRSIDHLLAFWAVAKTGAAFLPVDPRQPVRRVQTMLAESGCALGVTTAEHAPTLDQVMPPGPATQPRRWVVLDDPGTLAEIRIRPDTEIDDADRLAVLRPQNVAYAIYTSGSTGTPKGVLVTHEGLHNAFGELADRERGRHTSVRLCAVSATTFDAALYETLICLATRGAMVVAPPDVAAGPELAALLSNQQITHLVMTPQAWASIDPTGLESLRYAVTVGEACPPALVSTWAADRSLYNDYGPTESTIWATSAGPLRDTGHVGIGSPIRGIRALVLDGRLHPVPVGTPGELYLAGPQLARGYLARHELTASRFVANPFSGDGSRMYRTGDLVRWTATGELDYLGRNDNQVKLRGLRIETGEIESVLADHPDVERAAVVLHDDDVTGSHLIGYIQPAAQSATDADAIIDAVAQRLPRYMVPSQIIALDEFPLTPTGKLNRRALPAPDFTPHAQIAPTSPTEVVVAETVAGVLGIATPIGLDDDCFALGGNSLSATRLAARLSETLGVTVALRTIFDAASVGALARALQSSTDAGSPTSGPTVRQRPERLPLSAAQQRMWFLDRFDEAGVGTAIPIAVRVGGGVDVTALRAALLDVIERHEVLRTVYPEDESGVHADVLDPQDAADRLDVTEVPFSATTDLTTATGLSEAIDAEVARRFDLTSQLPIRVAILTPDPAGHVLVITLHHIAADGWSLAPLARDLNLAYRSRLGGSTPDFAPLPVQYADYALWQQDVWGGVDDDRSSAHTELEWWRRTLSGLPAALEPPTTMSRPAVPTYAAGHLPVELDAEITTGIRRLATTERATAYLVLHAAMAATLSRLCGAGDLAIGTPVAGRGAADLDDLVGVFINTVAIRTAVDLDAAFIDALKVTRDAALGAFAHAAVPFDQLVENLGIDRTAAHHPVVQNMITLRESHRAMLDLGEATLETIDVYTPTTPFDLVLELTDEGEEISGVLRYSQDSYSVDDAGLFRDAFVRTLRAVIADPAMPLGDIEILGSDVRRRMLNQCGPDPLPPRTLSDLLDDAAQVHPDVTAVIGADLSGVEREYTYGEFYRRAQNLARELIAAGVGPETHVVIALPRSPEYLLALWAVTSAGGAFVPIDPDLPPARIAHLVDDAMPVVGITATTFTAALPITPRWICLDDPATSAVIAAGPGLPVTDDERSAPLYADNTAYVIYTSGSTGAPKGVISNHTGLWDNLVHYSQTLRADESSRVLAVSAPTFDAHVAEILLALALSAPLVIAPPTAFAGEPLQSVIARHRVTVIEMTPRVLDTLDPTALPSVTTAISVGEACPPSVVERWSHVELHNDFGPTEATVRSSGVGPLRVGDPITIGTPGRGVGVFILDRRMQPTAPGVVGEMYLTGEHLARGYLRRAGLTADRFVANPHGAPGERMYRTGDLARWGADGQIRYLGRVDTQVKVRGLRIELGEIEAAITADPAVTAAVVVVHGDDEQLVAYVTAASPTATADPTDPAAATAFSDDDLVDRLKRQLASGLPRYMVPARFVVLEEFPLTSSGKVDRRALPEPAAATGGRRRARTDTERRVAEVFSALLPVTDPGVDDDFFVLGGNSLMATQLMARLGADRGIRLPVRTVFDASTVGALAAAVDAATAEISVPEVPAAEVPVADVSVPEPVPVAEPAEITAADEPVVEDVAAERSVADDTVTEETVSETTVPDDTEIAAEITDPVLTEHDSLEPDDGALWRSLSSMPQSSMPRGEHIPLSFAQRRIWFLNRLNPRGRAHLVPLALAIEGPLRVDMLRAAVDDVVARHEVLRTVYPDVNGVGRQHILTPAEAVAELTVVDVPQPAAGSTGTDAAGSFVERPPVRAAITQAIDALCDNGLDVTTDLPIRLQLLTIGPARHVLVVVLHHIAADGWSMAPLTADLLTAYHARCAGREPFAAPLPVQFADHALAQQEFLGDVDNPDSVLAAQAAYWQERLSGIPEALDLPTDRPRTAQPSFRHATVDRKVEPELATALAALAAGHRATTFMVLQAALSATLAWWTGTDDVVIGTPVAGRGEQQLDRMVGMFVNTLALRTRVDGSDTFSALVDHTRAGTLDDLANAELPLERVVDAVDPMRTTAHHPLFQVIMAFQNHASPSFIAGDLTVDPIDLGAAASSEFDIAISVDDAREDGALPIRFDYATDLFDASTIERLSRVYLLMLRIVAERPTVLVEEATAIAARSLSTDASTGRPARPVVAKPEVLTDLVAMPDGDPFGARVNQIARMLMSYGVAPELPVAVVLGPSLLASVAIHAVVASGGAWVPIDPDTPTDRIDQMIAVTGAVLGISTVELADTLPTSVSWMFLDDQAVLDVADTMAGDTITDADRLAPIRPDTLACIQPVRRIPTDSDSSSELPELVETTHAALAHRFRWLAAHLALNEDDVILHGAPLSSPDSVDELFLGPVSGACTVIAENHEIRDPAVMADLIAATGVTVARLASTLVAAMDLSTTATLRRIVTGAEPLTVGDARRIRGISAASLTHSHSTSATGVFFTHRVRAGDLNMSSPTSSSGWVPIGRPEPAGTAVVLDHRLRPTSPGIAGELYVSGPQLGRGYSNESALTSATFVANPAGPPGDRLYRTGDLARLRADGTIEYLGRADQPLRVRGVRVDLGVVESTLAAAPDVRRAAASLRTMRDEVVLIGYVELEPTPVDVTEPATDSRLNALRSYLADLLPQYLVPDQFVVVDHWDTDDHGALDRARLPLPSPGPLTHRDPVTDSELLVARAIKDILHANVAVGLDDTFFALGGTSLSALQLVARLREWSSGPAPVESLLRLVLTDPTVEVLARGMDVRAAQLHHDGRASIASGEIPIQQPAHARLAEPAEQDDTGHVVAEDAVAGEVMAGDVTAGDVEVGDAGVDHQADEISAGTVESNGVDINSTGVNGVGVNGAAGNDVAGNGAEVNGVGANGVATNGVGAHSAEADLVEANGLEVNGIEAGQVDVNQVELNMSWEEPAATRTPESPAEEDIDPALNESLAAAIGAPIIRLDDASATDTGRGDPVFFIHPLLGLSWPYVELAGYLAADHPVYGVQTPAFAEPSFAPRAFASLVGRYTDEITQVDAEGPYHLVGWSVGGTIAQAIAVELRIRGLEVASLTMIDPLHSTDPRSAIRLAQDESVFAAVGGRRENLSDTDILAIWKSMGGDVFPLSDVDATRITRAMLNIHQLSANHHPFVFDGVVLAVDSAQTVAEFGRASDTWLASCPRMIDVHTIDCPHGAMMTSDAVAEIGPVLRDWLRALAGDKRR